MTSACNKEKKNYEIRIPVSGIALSGPGSNDSINLNNEAVESYIFSWNNANEAGCTLVLSTSPYLLQPVYYNAGAAKSLKLSVDQLEQSFSGFGIESGRSGVIYWSVKPTRELTVAASEIRSFIGTRLKTTLLLPADQLYQELDGDVPDRTLQFLWETDRYPANTSFELVFGIRPDLSGNRVELPAGTGGNAAISHQQLQDVMDQLGVKKYTTEKLYWNVVEHGSGSLVSRSAASLSLRGMMILTDTRGTETIRYKVTRVRFSDGTSQIWLAENLRTSLFPDGTSISSNDVHFAPGSFGSDYVRAYGAYYSENVKMKIAPANWRLPTTADFSKLFSEAMLAPGGFGVLKDSVYYEKFDRSMGNINAWKLGLVTAGQWQGGNVVNQKNVYCYLHAEDVDAWKCVLHDNGTTLWYPWTDAANARFILDE